CCSSPVPSKMIEKPYGISLLPLTHGFIVCHKTSFPMTITQTEKALKFQKLHQQQGAFLIPNPWDAGSARILAGLGFEALATSSGASAAVFGRRDGKLSREEALASARAIAAATDLPVAADLE